MKKTNENKKAPVPCVCGRGGIVVKTRSGKMVSCPNPMKCSANLWTQWHSHEESAVIEWNGLVAAEQYRRRSKN